MRAAATILIFDRAANREPVEPRTAPSVQPQIYAEYTEFIEVRGGPFFRFANKRLALISGVAATETNDWFVLSRSEETPSAPSLLRLRSSATILIFDRRSGEHEVVRVRAERRARRAEHRAEVRPELLDAR